MHVACRRIPSPPAPRPSTASTTSSRCGIPEWFSRKERFGYHRALGAALEAPAIIASSAATAGDLTEAGADPQRVVLVPLGINDGFFTAGGDGDGGGAPEHDYDLFVGAVNTRKRVDVVVRGTRGRPPAAPSRHRGSAG